MEKHNKNVSKRIGTIIRTNRKRKNISQSELGEHLGISHATISRYESGKLPITVDSMEQIANFCHFNTREYMSAFCSDDDVRLAFRKLTGVDTELINQRLLEIENTLIKMMPNKVKPLIISTADALDEIPVDYILPMQNIVIEFVAADSDAQKKRIKKYMEAIQKAHKK